jgi:plastocyanin
VEKRVETVRLRRPILFPVAALLGAALAVLPAIAASEGSPTIEAVNSPGSYGEHHYWLPATATVSAGGVVTFQNTGALVPHGVVWTGGPETPSCTGVPINKGETNWKGGCTFTQPGTYTFHCYVHPTEMTGTITVNEPETTTETTTTGTTATETVATETTGTTPTETTTTGTTSATTSQTQPPPTTSTTTSPASMTAAAQPLLGGGTTPSLAGSQRSVLATLALAGSQHGPSVHGSLEVSTADAEGRLEVDLLANSASLARVERSARVRVGRLVLSSLRPGRVSFSVPLSTRARRALGRRRRLALMVKIILQSRRGVAVTATHAVVLHA